MCLVVDKAFHLPRLLGRFFERSVIRLAVSRCLDERKALAENTLGLLVGLARKLISGVRE